MIINYCKCGCNNPTKGDNDFLLGHNRRKMSKELRYCKCGCGNTFKCYITSNQKFIFKHNKGKFHYRYIPIEIRICLCGCNKTFECKISSKKHFVLGHNNVGKVGENSNNFKHGNYSSSIIHYCIEKDCNKVVNRSGNRCYSCAKRGKLNSNYISGDYGKDKIYYCQDINCSNKVSRHTSTYCRRCVKKGERNPNFNKKLSKETKAKISKNRKGKPLNHKQNCCCGVCKSIRGEASGENASNWID